MNTYLTIANRAAIATIAILAVALSYSALAKESKPHAKANPALVEQGRYLVHHVAMCIDCHSPRGPDGRFIETMHLTGSPLAFTPSIPMPWSPAAPNLVGLPAHYTPEAMVKFLMTGERPGGLAPALPPMPEFRFNQQDAIALTAYLESLAPAK